MHVLSMIAIGAVAVVAIGWLAVSFLGPTAQRRKIEWIAASALYVALLTFFVNLVRRSVASDNEAGMVAFGFLTAMFAAGLLLSLWKTVGALRGRAAASGKASETH
jgi:protein-S-isoprenylcysteine O-methyltransferase Ste14